MTTISRHFCDLYTPLTRKAQRKSRCGPKDNYYNRFYVSYHSNYVLCDSKQCNYKTNGISWMWKRGERKLKGGDIDQLYCAAAMTGNCVRLCAAWTTGQLKTARGAVIMMSSARDGHRDGQWGRHSQHIIASAAPSLRGKKTNLVMDALPW